MSGKGEGTKKGKGLFTRRGFLLSGGLLLGGTAATWFFGHGHIRRRAFETARGMDLPSGVFNFEPDFWFAVRDDNTILLKSPKSEMGQDIFTGFALLAAEELDVAVEQIEVRPSSTSDTATDFAGTGGSSTTASLYVPIREVAATLRETLKQEAARQWGVDVARVETTDGHLRAGEHSASYAEIASSRGDEEWKIADTPELRPAAEFRLIGKDHRRTDLRPKVFGEAIFGIDAELPDMVHATILYCPHIGGSLARLDTSRAESYPGVLQVVRDGDLVAVVAESRYAAEMALRQVEAEWDVPKRWQQADIEELVTVGNGSGVSLLRHGDHSAAIEEGPGERIRAEFRTPLAAHAHMEPNGVVAEVKDDRALIIIGTQVPFQVQQDVASALGISRKKVEIRNRFLGGGFGRRYFLHNAADAARIARAVGRPVHVFKTREDEFRNGYLRPNAHHVLSARLEADGSIHAFEHLMASGDMLLENGPLAATKWFFGADWLSAGHGIHILYDAAHKNAEMWHKTLPFQTGIWRGVGMVTTTFAVESFVDDLARHAGREPLQFRLDHLRAPDPISRRLRAVLEAAAEASGWSGPREAGEGWGIACAEDRKTVVAAVARVTVDDDGRIRVRKITQAIDPGVIVHPEGVRNQVEGATMMGLGNALYEEIRVEDGQLHATNYHQYPMAMLDDTPEIEVLLLEGAEKPSGVGEPPIAPIAPAIANAVFDLTGQRLRRLPLRLGSA